MIKRTLLFSNPCHLSVKNRQLLVSFRDERKPQLVPTEDIGFIVLENHSITMTLKLFELLNEFNIAVIFCDSKHMPCSMNMTFAGHTTHSETLRFQIEAGKAFYKQLWKSTVFAKITNQALALKKYRREGYEFLTEQSKRLKSGDMDNREGVAAKHYWKSIFSDFKRERDGDYPNSLLNYGYAILRGAVARALAGSGLYPAIGIQHHNRYNAFCLADDIMEPYRTYVDEIVYNIVQNNRVGELTLEVKAQLLKVLTVDTVFKNCKSPLMIAISRTTSSLAKSFAKKENILEFPRFE